jgi:hypothetical protein
MDCFAYGPCHSSLLIPLFFPFCTSIINHDLNFFPLGLIKLNLSDDSSTLVALGQTMVRLNTETWIALPTYRPNDPFRVAILLTMFWITANCLIYYLAVVTAFKWILFFVIGGVMHLYLATNSIRTRLATRRRFRIEESWKHEDLWIAGVVPAINLMQLLRHTGEYDRLAGHGFTATGLAVRVRFVLPAVQQEENQYSIFSESPYTT